MIRFDMGRALIGFLAATAVLLVLAGVVIILAGERRAPAYSLTDVRAGTADVPRTFLAGLPEAALEDAESAARKDIFVRTILPLVLHSNEAIRSDRTRLMGLSARRDSGTALRRKDRAWLSRLAARYGAESVDLAALARRVDVIPPALALAQAAVESGWGTSRFAREGNALFGLRSFGGVAGLAPKELEGTANFAVRRYKGLAESVRVYMHTLNTHPAYGEFRGVRAAARAQGRAVDAKDLLLALEGYAENPGYIGLLSKVMGDGRFRELDGAALAGR